MLLREVGARTIVSCKVPAGYAGSEGEIWVVRVLPLPHALFSREWVGTLANALSFTSSRARCTKSGPWRSSSTTRMVRQTSK